jgi:hypothetical protein
LKECMTRETLTKFPVSSVHLRVPRGLGFLPTLNQSLPRSALSSQFVQGFTES